jgi:hypothetical protein
MRDDPFRFDRRAMSKLLIALPMATLPVTRQTETEEPSATAEFIASQAEGLSDEERAKLKENVTELEGALGAIRDFRLDADVAPCLRFQAIKSERG